MAKHKECGSSVYNSSYAGLPEYFAIFSPYTWLWLLELLLIAVGGICLTIVISINYLPSIPALFIAVVVLITFSFLIPNIMLNYGYSRAIPFIQLLCVIYILTAILDFISNQSSIGLSLLACGILILWISVTEKFNIFTDHRIKMREWRREEVKRNKIRLQVTQEEKAKKGIKDFISGKIMSIDATPYNIPYNEGQLPQYFAILSSYVWIIIVEILLMILGGALLLSIFTTNYFISSIEAYLLGLVTVVFCISTPNFMLASGYSRGVLFLQLLCVVYIVASALHFLADTSLISLFPFLCGALSLWITTTIKFKVFVIHRIKIGEWRREQSNKDKRLREMVRSRKAKTMGKRKR